jgi:predicted small metal-binding protein
VIDCQCGATLKAANDAELEAEVRAHVERDHPDMEMGDDALHDFVAANAYDASDS